MRTDTDNKTHITSLLATAAVTAFALWIASFTAQPDSLFAPPAPAAHAQHATSVPEERRSTVQLG